LSKFTSRKIKKYAFIVGQRPDLNAKFLAIKKFVEDYVFKHQMYDHIIISKMIAEQAIMYNIVNAEDMETFNKFMAIHEKFGTNIKFDSEFSTKLTAFLKISQAILSGDLKDGIMEKEFIDSLANSMVTNVKL